MDTPNPPDHAIVSPHAKLTVQHERFEKYRDHIIPWFKDIYALGRHSKRPWDCSVCDTRIGTCSQTSILQHLSSLKHLKAAGVLEDEKDYRRRVSKKEATDT